VDYKVASCHKPAHALWASREDLRRVPRRCKSAWCVLADGRNPVRFQANREVLALIAHQHASTGCATEIAGLEQLHQYARQLLAGRVLERKLRLQLGTAGVCSAHCSDEETGAYRGKRLRKLRKPMGIRR
jgi:hypothetical protein